MRAGKKERKEEEPLRVRIVKVAADAFLRQGIKSVRMDDVAAMLTISKRTLYEVFSDKEELLYSCILYLHEEECKRIDKIVAGSDNVMEIVLKCWKFQTDRLTTTYKDFIFEINKYPIIQKYIVKERKQQSQRIIDFFKKGVEQGYFLPELNYEFLVKWLHFQGDFMLSSILYPKYTMEEVFDTLMYVNMRGIATEKGLRVLNDFKEKNERSKA